MGVGERKKTNKTKQNDKTHIHTHTHTHTPIVCFSPLPRENAVLKSSGPPAG